MWYRGRGKYMGNQSSRDSVSIPRRSGRYSGRQKKVAGVGKEAVCSKKVVAGGMA